MVRCHPFTAIKYAMCLAFTGYMASVALHLRTSLFVIEKTYDGPLHHEGTDLGHPQLQGQHVESNGSHLRSYTNETRDANREGVVQASKIRALQPPVLENPDEPSGAKHPPDDTVVEGNDTNVDRPIIMAPPQPEDKYAFGELWRGALGHPVIVDETKLPAEERAKYDKGWNDHKFNEYVSNMISLHRSLPPVSIRECHKRARQFPANLPNSSVILVFHNEAWSTLLRTVHSVIDRSPAELLREVILVDDASDMPHLQKPLEDYVANLPQVRLLRAGRRGGLIKARLLGAREARGEVLVYLDSHCECFPGWLEPMLVRIALNSTTVVCPIIENIDDRTFQVLENDSFFIGGFDWDLIFSWKTPSDRRKDARKTRADEYTSPTMAGGLFAIDRKFFEHLGTYDPEFDFWGGENLELSFKLWMCGGRLEFVPCSRVAHVFRKDSPHKGPGANYTSVVRNSLRVAAVWMDDYKDVYFSSFDKLPDYGDVSQRKALRSRLQCQTFDWYLKEVYSEGIVPARLGTFESRQSSLCLDSHAGRGTKEGTPDAAIIAFPCHGQGGTQAFMVTTEEEIRKVDLCLDANNGNVTMMRCHGYKGNQHWIYGNDQTIRLGGGDHCLALVDSNALRLEPCHAGNLRHQWKGPKDLRRNQKNEERSSALQ